MKLRYYLRGIGVGILVSTIVLSVSFRNKAIQKLTNDEIIKRASQLGMVFEKDGIDSLDDLLKPAVLPEDGENISDNEIADDNDVISENKIDNNIDKNSINDIEVISGNKIDNNNKNNNINDITDNSTDNENSLDHKEGLNDQDNNSNNELDYNDLDNNDIGSDEVDSIEEDNEDLDRTDETINVIIDDVKTEYVTVYIEKGMNADEIAFLLEDNEVIDNAYVIIKYLRDNKYTTKLKYGSFRLPKGLSFEETIEVIKLYMLL